MNRWITILLAGAIAIGGAHALDGWFYEHLADRRTHDPFSRIPDWRMAFRIAGYAPLWFLAALVLFLHWRPGSEPCRKRILSLVTLPLISVLCVELVKMLVRRRRPIDSQGAYEFIPWPEEFRISSSGMGFPSSHSAVAFTACFVLAAMFPRSRFIWIAIGLGCALSRVAYRHHFFSDVITGGVIAFVVVALFYPTPRGAVGQKSAQTE